MTALHKFIAKIYWSQLVNKVKLIEVDLFESYALRTNHCSHVNAHISFNYSTLLCNGYCIVSKYVHVL